MNYADFTARDFEHDEYFQNWVLQPDPENSLFWENWLAAHPHQQAAAAAARRLLLALALKPRHLPEAHVARIWDHLQDHMEKTGQQQHPAVTEASRRFPAWYQMAAVFLGLLLAGIGLWKIQQPAGEPLLVTTGYGETRKVVLPDNSIVVMNGNSAISYPRHWDREGARQVTLRGEAYFAVSHTKNHQPFQVRLSNELKVAVLGTRFLVTSRPRITQVVLQEGKVAVALSSRKARGAVPVPATRTVMAPGDLVVVRAGRLDKRQVSHPEDYLAFVQSKLIFKDTPLSEVARVLEDNYGYKITFAEPALAARRFTGTGQHKRIDMLLTAIEKSFNLKISRQGKRLLIQRK